MSDSETPSEQRAHFRELIEDFPNGMLVTRTEDDELHARPMSVAGFDETTDLLTFVTAIKSEKVDEIARHPQVSVTFQSRTKYLAVSGRARVEQDRARVHELWSEAWKLWFPEGPDDPDIALIDVDPKFAEYWDMSGIRGLRYLWEAGKAYFQGERLDKGPDPEGTHAVVPLENGALPTRSA